MSPVLLFHVSAGVIGLLAGALAMIFRKGSGKHRLAGNIFFVSMLVMSAGGAYLGMRKGEHLNALNGGLAFYLVSTGWIAGRRRAVRTGMFDIGALLLGLGVGAALWTYGFEAANSPTGSKGGYPAAMYFVFGSIAMLCAATDVRMIIRGGVSGTKRIARHLWRMGFVLFMAAGSFYPGQAQVFPEAWRKSNVLFLPLLLTIVMTLYWVWRVSFTKKAVAVA
jgi:uncharacterized membrane protein